MEELHSISLGSLWQHELYEKYLGNHNEMRLLVSWDRWGYTARFHYSAEGWLRAIEYYEPKNRYWSKCELFFYKRGRLSEQYLLEQWPHTGGAWSFRRNRYAFSYDGSKTQIEYFTASGMKWAVETRLYDDEHRLLKVVNELTEKWRQRRPLSIDFVYTRDGVLAEKQVEWGTAEEPSPHISRYQYDDRRRLVLAEHSPPGVRAVREERKYLADGSIECSVYGATEGPGPVRSTIALDEHGNPREVTCIHSRVSPSVWRFSYSPNPAYRKGD